MVVGFKNQEDLDLFFKRISTVGAFLNVEADDQFNTMTIGWATVGYLWGKPVLTVYVRYSRHTYTLLKKANSFTISVPVEMNDSIKMALKQCGRQTGRYFNKVIENKLTLTKARQVNGSVISGCGLHVECKIIHRQALEPSQIPVFAEQKYYQDHDYHMVYYGEIVDSYSE